MKTLVVTGGIGSGKSEVCAYLEKKGIPVYNSDQRAKALYDENPAIVSDIEEALGVVLTDPEGRLDRRKLASIVFSDPEKLKILEDIVHPLIFEDFLRWRNDHFDVAPFLVMESAILMEKPLFHSLADKILLIDAPLEVRAMLRDDSSRDAVVIRMKSQRFDKSKVDAVIENDKDLKTLYRKTEETLQTIWN